jgi:sarcosine oxidase subunit gamma
MAEPVATDLAQVALRGPDPSAFPFAAPEANRVTSWGERHVLWLGPDEWLVVGPAGTEATIVRELEAQLRGRFASIVDVSANRVAFDLADALDVLATGCPIDLDPSRWRPGACAQTLFGAAPVLLQQLGGRTTRIFVRPSFAGYLIARLGAATLG